MGVNPRPTGQTRGMKIGKMIRGRLRDGGDEHDAGTDVHAVISANVGRGQASSQVSSHETIVQRAGATEVTRKVIESQEEADERAR